MIKPPLQTFDVLPCTALKGVGPRTAALLKKLGIIYIKDLLLHLPFRYQDRTRISPMGSLRVGDFVVVEGTIELVQLSKGRRVNSLLCYLHDGTGHLTVRFFHFNYAQQQTLQRGLRMRCFGELRWSVSGLEIIHPEYQILKTNEPVPVDEHLTPIYPTTEGIHQSILRRLIRQSFAMLDQNPDLIPDFLPDDIKQSFRLPNFLDSLRFLHQPSPEVSIDLLERQIHPAQKRLICEELLTHQLGLLRFREQIQQYRAPILQHASELLAQFIAALPFSLTFAQQRVNAEIAKDLVQEKPMLRLVQGDVGSGKTVVAAIAAISAIANGYQVALMAPTELLAEQHFNNFQNWFAPLGIHVNRLTGKLQGRNRETILAEMENGKCQCVIGTHALFQEQVQFSNLALVIIDEQHRFGVHQRLALREKGEKNGMHPHQLIMTATPIPRTLAMTAYADLDCSVIDELPPGRTPVTTLVISNQRRHEVIQRVRENCKTGKQAYWVCTLIEESELLQCQAAEVTASQLTQALPELRIGLIHGRIKSKQKEEIMSAFKNKAIDLLIATTVIEVGVDVPNASLMIIENPERLGLAQLHQLRGRVGRGSVESHCVLLYQLPLSQQSKERLTVMRQTQDGFEIAQRDLELRGPGEVLGTRQTGLMQFKIANLMRDKELIVDAQTIAKELIKHYPQNLENLIVRWLGSVEQFGNV